METSKEIDLQTAPPILRLFGHIFDWVIGIVLSLVIFGVIADNSSGRNLAAILLLVIFIILQIVMMAKSTSLGKRLLGLKVYNINTKEPIGFFMMLIRETLGKIISTLVFSLGFIWILLDKDKQGWHDKLVSSIVCKMKKS